MLQMNCPKCDGLIKSPLLVEVRDIKCSQCHETVEIKNVVVSTRNFSMQRSDLTNRVSHYKKLLREVEKEMQNKEIDAPLNKKNSSDNLRSSLKDLLLAARDNFRLNLSYDLYVQINFETHKRLARLLNISSTGAAIEFVDRGQVPGNNAVIKCQLLLPGYTESLQVVARVVWSRKLDQGVIPQSVNMGVQFKDLDEKTRSCIWDFIVEAESSPQA